MRNFLLVLLVFISMTAPAYAQERAEVELRRIQSIAQREADAAEADIKLVNGAGLAMHRAYRAGGPNKVAALDGSLETLRSKFPDKRLRYMGEQDRCQILAAFSDIRSDALYRAERALNVAADAAMRLAIYHMLQAEIMIANDMGQPVTSQTISDTFMKTIDAEKELAVFNPDNSMGLPTDEPGECD